MKQATVILPVVGEVQVTLDLNEDATDQEAIDAAFEVVDFRVTGAPNVEPLEFECLETIVQGNVACFMANNSANVEWDDE